MAPLRCCRRCARRSSWRTSSGGALVAGARADMVVVVRVRRRELLASSGGRSGCVKRGLRVRRVAGACRRCRGSVFGGAESRCSGTSRMSCNCGCERQARASQLRGRMMENAGRALPDACTKECSQKIERQHHSVTPLLSLSITFYSCSHGEPYFAHSRDQWHDHPPPDAQSQQLRSNRVYRESVSAASESCGQDDRSA